MGNLCCCACCCKEVENEMTQVSVVYKLRPKPMKWASHAPGTHALPVEVCHGVEEGGAAAGDGDYIEKCSTNIAKYLTSINKLIVAELKVENNGRTPVKGCGGRVITELCDELFQSGVLILLIQNLDKLEFETRKYVGYIYTNLLHEKFPLSSQMATYLAFNRDILCTLIHGYKTQQSQIFSQIILQCVLYESLTRAILETGLVDVLFNFAQSSSFEMASVARKTIKALLPRNKHKALCAEYLINNYEPIIERFTNELIVSDNYATQAEFLNILAEILFQRQHKEIVTRFVASTKNLKLVMGLLNHWSKRIRIGVFNVFKAFFALPTPNDPKVDAILFNNKEKLLKCLSEYRQLDMDSEPFQDDISFIMKKISELQKVKHEQIPKSSPKKNPATAV